MKKLKSVLFEENIGCGYLYFYVHFIIEVVCFFHLSRITNSPIAWLIPFLYDAFAFVPQGLVGKIVDKHPKINISMIGVIFTFVSMLLFGFNANKFITLFLICIGNCFIHVGGAENTLRNSKGKLSHSAIFVAGGSFGVITGRLLAKTSISPFYLLPVILTMIPFIMLANTYNSDKNDCREFDYVKKGLSPWFVVIIAFLVVIVRGYMGYGIPTSWNKTVLQNVYLFCIMGLGKALGGILSDRFGIRKVAIISTLLAIPFLAIGDSLMIVSLIGVMFFSMTMSITLAILVSVLKKSPGLAFGITTIGLFLGTVPIFFIKITSKMANIVMIAVLSILCSILLGYVLKGGKNND